MDTTPRGKQRMLFGSLLALAVAAVIELLSYGAIAIALRRAPGLAAIHAQQSEIARIRTATEFDREVRFRGHYRRELVHPYVGFIDGATLGELAGIDLAEETELPRRSPDRLLVAITGGSVASDFAVDADSVLVPRLAAAPILAGREIEIVTLAVSGWKQPQQLMALAYLLAAGGELDVLINLDGFNEVALHGEENRGAGVFPAFPRNWAMRVRPVPDRAAMPIAGRHAELERARKHWARGFSRPPLRWSATAGFVWLVHDRMLGAQLFETQREFFARAPDVTDYAWTGPQMRFASESETMRELVAIWSRSSVQLDHLCRENGIHYLHLLQPNQYVAGSKPMSRDEQRIAINERGWARRGAEPGYPLLSRECARLAAAGHPCHDLTRLFAEVPETLYVDDCCHFNHRGYELVGAYAAEAVLDGLASGRSRVAGADARAPSREAAR